MWVCVCVCNVKRLHRDWSWPVDHHHGSSFPILEHSAAIYQPKPMGKSPDLKITYYSYPVRAVARDRTCAKNPHCSEVFYFYGAFIEGEGSLLSFARFAIVQTAESNLVWKNIDFTLRLVCRFGQSHFAATYETHRKHREKVTNCDTLARTRDNLSTYHV